MMMKSAIALPRALGVALRNDDGVALRKMQEGESRAFLPSPLLLEQIKGMVMRHEDYLPEADGVDGGVHVVVNDFDEGVWLCGHHGECNMHKYTRIQRLA